jgi:hypothetical protein
MTFVEYYLKTSLNAKPSASHSHSISTESISPLPSSMPEISKDDTTATISGKTGDKAIHDRHALWGS